MADPKSNFLGGNFDGLKTTVQLSGVDPYRAGQVKVFHRWKVWWLHTYHSPPPLLHYGGWPGRHFNCPFLHPRFRPMPRFALPGTACFICTLNIHCCTHNTFSALWICCTCNTQYSCSVSTHCCEPRLVKSKQLAQVVLWIFPTCVFWTFGFV